MRISGRIHPVRSRRGTGQQRCIRAARGAVSGRKGAVAGDPARDQGLNGLSTPPPFFRGLPQPAFAARIFSKSSSSTAAASSPSSSFPSSSSSTTRVFLVKGARQRRRTGKTEEGGSQPSRLHSLVPFLSSSSSSFSSSLLLLRKFLLCPRPVYLQFPYALSLIKIVSDRVNE